MIRKTARYARLSLLLLALCAYSACTTAPPSGGDPAMRLHHLHSLMNHGFEMILQGGDLTMLAGMGMAEGEDARTLEHGKNMLQAGRELIQTTLDSPAMQELHSGGEVPHMAETHSLGEAMLAVADAFEQMSEGGMEGQEAMKLHHIHILLSHAGHMATEGIDLVMLGQMGMAGTADEAAVHHGQEMLAQSGRLYDQLMGGDSMQSLHQAGASSEAIGHTHALGEGIIKVIDLYSEIHGVGHGH